MVCPSTCYFHVADREQEIAKQPHSLKMLLQIRFFVVIVFFFGHIPYDHLKVFQHNTLYMQVTKT